MSVINQLTSSLRDVYYITNHIKALEYKCIYKICHYIMYILGRPFVYMVEKHLHLRNIDSNWFIKCLKGITLYAVEITDQINN